MATDTHRNIVFKQPSELTGDTVAEIFDNEWVKSTFIITDKEFKTGGGSWWTNPQTGVLEKKDISPYEQWIRSNRYSTSADHKFASTSPGMSLGVNPKPQFTRYCDIRSKGRVQTRPDVTVSSSNHHSTGLGMGGYYSTAIDDNQQRVFFRFGVPTYMPLPIWIAKAFDINRAVLQGRGTITSTFLEAVNVISTFFMWKKAFLMSLAMFAVKTLSSNSRFYSVKPTMYVYWSTVENILNSLVARRTMLPHILKDYNYKLQETVGDPPQMTEAFLNELNKFIPDIIPDPSTGRISVFAIALRGQSVFNRIRMKELTDNVNINKIDDATLNQAEGVDGRPHLDMESITPNKPYAATSNADGSWVTYLFKKASQALMGSPADDNVEGLDDKSATMSNTMSFHPMFTDTNGKPINVSLDPNDPNDSPDKKIMDNVNNKKEEMNKYADYVLAELTEGAAFAVFNVESTGSVGESFSSSFGANPIEATFNAFSAKARNLGSLLSSATEVPIIGDALKLAADTGALILSNNTFGLANPLLALAYGVNVSMPKIWESSSASLPKSSYKIKLISPYGNSYSQLFNIYMPLAMILAGSLPRTTGASSYNSPFFCECYDKGRNNIQLGMISNVSITRGTSNLAFSRAGHPNAIDVDMTVESLDEIVSVDVSSSGVISKLANLPDFGETPFTGYMNTIAAVDVHTLAFRVPMIRLKLAEKYMIAKSVINPDPAAFAAFTVQNIPGLGFAQNFLGNPAATLQDLGNI